MRLRRQKNRRCYDLDKQAWMNLDDIARAAMRGEPLEVVDVGTGSDVTASIMLTLLQRELDAGRTLPVETLVQLFRAVRAKRSERDDVFNRLDALRCHTRVSLDRVAATVARLDGYGSAIAGGHEARRICPTIWSGYVASAWRGTWIRRLSAPNRTVTTHPRARRAGYAIASCTRLHARA